MDAALMLEPLCPPPGGFAVITLTGDQRPLSYDGFSLWANAQTEQSSTVGARSSAGSQTRPRRVEARSRQRWRSPSAYAPANFFDLC
jgi:hypothetical protein